MKTSDTNIEVNMSIKALGDCLKRGRTLRFIAPLSTRLNKLYTRAESITVKTPNGEQNFDVVDCRVEEEYSKRIYTIYLGSKRK